MSHIFKSGGLCVLIALAILFGLDGKALAQGQWSPNGFQVGQCTWFVDGAAAQAGWRLSFRNLSNANAANWPGNLCNATIRQFPFPWWDSNIVVFLPPRFPLGHVAYVNWLGTSGGTTFFTIAHANWATGQPIGWIQGVPIYQDTYQVVGPGLVRRLQTGAVYSVL